MNEELKTRGHLSGLPFAEEALKFLDIKVVLEGIENIEKEKQYVFASNHPLGGLDGVAIIYKIGTEIGKTKAIVNDILLNFHNFRPLFAGVNVYGKFSKQQIKKIDKLYRSDIQIIVFPAGLVSRKIKGKITDLKWKKSFITKSIQYKRDIIPVFIGGKNSNFFYNFANLRKFFGFKFNIELIYLPDEMFGYRGKTITIKVGKPIPFETFDKSKHINEWVEYVRSKTYKLAE